MEQTSEGHLQNLYSCKKIKVLASILPLVDHPRLYQEADLVPPWTRTFAVAKDQVLSCLTSIY
jgi:hypothetical protein